MRKKIYAVLFVVFFSLFVPLLADGEAGVKRIESFEPLYVEFTSEKTVLSGFADRLVSGTTLGEATDITGGSKKFSYDSDNGWFFVNNIFYYVQVFVSSDVTITISGDPLKNASGEELDWSSEVGKYGGNINTETNQVITIDESKIESVNNNLPRVYSDEILIRIPVDEVKDTSGSYEASLTLTVTYP